jgi:hypothetical protein
MSLEIKLEVMTTIQDELVIQVVIDGKRIVRLNYTEFQEFKRIVNAVEIGRME